MKNLRINVFFVISIIISITLLVGCGNKVIENENVNKEILNSGEVEYQSELNNKKESEEKGVFEYIPLSEIPTEYTIENAIEDNCFTISYDFKLYNENILKSFENSVVSFKDAKLRVAIESINKSIFIVDIECSGDKIKVVQDETRLSEEGLVQENVYLFSEGYMIESENTVLEDGNTIKYYQLRNNNTEEKVEIFGYICSFTSNEQDESGDI